MNENSPTAMCQIQKSHRYVTNVLQRLLFVNKRGCYFVYVN